jgi:Protein of unknown function (DUF3352)
MRLRSRRVPLTAALAVAVVALSGCGGKEAGTALPPSASLAPKDAIAYVTLVSDEGSGQWQRADRLLRVFPHARESVLSDVEHELSDEGLSWEKDVVPAFGPEVVVVVTAGNDVVAFTQPDDEKALQALMRRSDEPVVTGEISGWTAIADKQSVIDGFRASLGEGSLADVETFRDAFSGLPADAIARGWVDLTAAVKSVAAAFEGSEKITDVEVQDLAAALSAEDDGVLLSVGIRVPKGTGSTTYEPKLLDRVPADAVVAVSFGGTQGALDKVERTIDVEGILGAIDDTIGVPLDSVLEALSGEGVLYVRDSGADIPEVTLVLDPPDADKTWSTIEKVANKAAADADGHLTTGTEGGRAVKRLELEGATVRYARLDSETILVTTSARGIDGFLAEGSKLTDADDFRVAADRVGLGDRTKGFAYVDLDGLIPFIESVGGPDAMPDDGREVLSAMDSVILQASGDGKAVRLTGFLRIPG